MDLVIKGKKYNRKTLTNLPEDLNTYSLLSTENDNTISFFGELNPLSNFYMAPFVYNNSEYLCSKQLIQHQKAKLFGDTEIASKILDATDAVTCKCLSKDINNFDMAKWKDEAKLHCEERIKAKFMQNVPLHAYLLNTKNKKIVECSADKLWGNGIQLKEEDCLNPSK